MHSFITLLIPFLLGTKYAGEFQSLGVGGRACGMGGVGVAQCIDPTTLYFNPAGSYFTESGILLMHAENFAGVVKNDFGSIVFPGKKLIIGASIQYVSVGDIKLTTLNDTTEPPGNDNPPIVYDTVQTRDLISSLNFAKGNPRLSYGGNIKVYYRDLTVINGFGGGIDCGLLLHLRNFNLGMAVRDFILSPLIWNNGTKETIPPKLSLGLSPTIRLEKIDSRIILECDLVKCLALNGFETNFGFEFSYKNLVSGRCGGYKNGYTIGIGLLYKRLCIDYALVTHREIKNSNKISARLIF